MWIAFLLNQFLVDLWIAGFIPGDPAAFVAQLSEKLAEFAPQLTLDFIHEVSAAMTSMDKKALASRIGCLSYMSPWIQNLSHFANVTHNLYERSGARLRDCIRTLAGLSLSFPEVFDEEIAPIRIKLMSYVDHVNHTEGSLVRSCEARLEHRRHSS